MTDENPKTQSAETTEQIFQDLVTELSKELGECLEEIEKITDTQTKNSQ